MGGLECRACRRFVLGWPHIALLIILTVAALLGLLELTAW